MKYLAIFRVSIISWCVRSIYYLLNNLLAENRTLSAENQMLFITLMFAGMVFLMIRSGSKFLNFFWKSGYL